MQKREKEIDKTHSSQSKSKISNQKKKRNAFALKERASKEFEAGFEVKSEQVCDFYAMIYTGKANDWKGAIAAVVFEGEKSTRILRNVDGNLGDTCDLQIFRPKEQCLL